MKTTPARAIVRITAILSAVPPQPSHFGSACAEAGAIALATDRGVLLRYNGANRAHDQGGDCACLPGWVGLGQALFAVERPAQLVARLDRPFLHAEFDWELREFTPPAVVANGRVFFKGEWLLYYGAADRRIGLAVCRSPNR